MKQRLTTTLIALLTSGALSAQDSEVVFDSQPVGETMVLEETMILEEPVLFADASVEMPEDGVANTVAVDAPAEAENDEATEVADSEEATSATDEATEDMAADATENDAIDAEVEAVVVDLPTDEMPEMGIEEADEVAPVITEVVDVLPTDTELVLDLPGDESGSTSMSSDEKISVDFPDEDIRNILLNVAELFDLNLVIPDALQGRSSIKFKNVSWRVVYTEALRPLGYTFEEDRNIIRVVSFEEQAVEPPDTRVFVVNYAKAGDIQTSIAPLVDSAAGGRMQVDTRSNALVITERPSRMNKIQEILERLDRPTHQVMVEAKFIEVLDTDIKDLGVNWSSLNAYNVSAGPFQRDYSSADTQLKGAEQPYGGTLESVAQMTKETVRLDTAVFNADAFNVVLSALEQTRDSKLVSNPTVVVMNNEPAVFEVGQDYPVREVTFNQETGTYEAGEVTKEFIGIGLKVTPSVNAAGMINLEVNPKISSLDGQVESLGAIDPIIGKREALTRVTVKDGFTLALGGLSETRESDGETRVPVLGNVPVLGRLFRSDTKNSETRNLIVFITSKTLNPDGSSYKEVIDPRMIHDMGITPSDIPDYEVSEEQIELYEKLAQMKEEVETLRSQKALEQEMKKLENTEQSKG